MNSYFSDDDLQPSVIVIKWENSLCCR